MLLFVSDAFVKLLLSLAVFLAACIKLTDTLVSLLPDDASDVLEVVEENFALLLLLGVLVELVDLPHVVQLLVEILLRVNESIEQVAILAILFGLEVERVEELEETLGELSDLDIRRTSFNLPLNHCDLPVLVGEQLLLLDHLFVLLVVLSLDLSENRRLFLLFNFHLALLHLHQLLFKARLLLLARFLELDLGLCKSSLFFDKSGYDDNLMLLHRSVLLLCIKSISLLSNLFNLLFILTTFIV